MLRVLIYNRFAEQYRDLLAPRFPNVVFATTTTEAGLREAIGGADVLVGWKFPLEVLDGARPLRWVQVLSAGVDHLGDLKRIDERVAITSSKGMHGDIVADYVLAMVLAWAWRLPEVLKNQEQRQWRELPARPLTGRLAGIVGLGHIGAEVARRLHAVGMRVRGTKRHVESIEGVEHVYPAEGLLELLGQAEVVVLTVPLTEETRGLLGPRQFRTMRPDAYLVNVSRGPVVDAAALARALREGWIAGAAVDVFPIEPVPADDEIWALPNLLVTPHVSGERSDYVERAVGIFAENLERFLAGRPLTNPVDRKKGY